MARSRTPRKYKHHRSISDSRSPSYAYSDDRSNSRRRSRDRHRSSRRRHKRDKNYRRDRRRNRHRRRYRSRGYSDSVDSRDDRSYSRDRTRSRSYSEERRRKKKHHKKHKHRRHDRRRDRKRDYSYKKEKKRTPKDDSEDDDDKDRTKDAGHYKHKNGILIQDQYKILKHLGDGTFGRVLEVEDIKTNKTYAMKVIRAVERYVDSAITEAQILEDIKKKDPNDEYQIVRLEAAFLQHPSNPKKQQNYFMVFEKLGMSLYDFLKMNNYRGFPIELIQSFAKQMLSSIGFMHSIGLTHTDLKPENVLLVNDEAEEIKIRKSEEDSGYRSSTCSNSPQERIYHKPKFDQIKIIDMGGATYDSEHHSSVINTRQYRAPEVMLGCCEWDHSSDVWSIGCILLELYTGDLFFETHETYEHLAMIDRACGPIPYWMGNRAEKSMRKHFVLEDDFYEKHHTFFDWPKHASGIESIQRVKEMRLINDIIPSNYPELRDLLQKLLTVDPKKRISCMDALKHPFFEINYKDAPKA